MANYTRKKGFSILSFLLGIIFGMIILVAGVAGVLLYALKTDVDTALNMVGIENKDEDGNNVYINTDLETGGAASLLDLVSKVSALASVGEELSVSDVEGLLPVVGGFVDGLYEMVNGFIPMERAELTGVRFAEIGDFVQTKLLDVQPAALLENFGMEGLVENKLLSAILLGSEADYVQVGENSYPLYYDNFAYDGGVFSREGDGAVLAEKYTDDIEETEIGYRVYYYLASGIAYTKNTGAEYALYTPEYASLTGCYYISGDERIVVTPITLRDFADGQFSMLESVYLTDLFADGNDFAEEIFGGITLADLLTKGIDFQAILNGLAISDFVEIKATEPIMAYIGYGLYGVEAVEGGYTASYDANGMSVEAYVETDSKGVIDNCYYLDGETRVAIKGTGLDDISSKIEGLTKKLKISELMGEIDEDNVILYNLKDTTIFDLPDAIATLTINCIYASEIYKTDDAPAELKLAQTFNSDYLYYNLNDGKYELVDFGKGLGKLDLSDFKVNTFYTYGSAQGVWKMLLYAETKDGDTKTETAYTVNNLTDMIENVADNMSNSSLYDLHNAGILIFADPSKLDKVIPVSSGESKKLGDMGLMDFINYSLKFV